MGKFIDLSGNKYNRLLVIKRAPNKGRNTMFKCICDCGTIKDIGASNLKSGGTKSCGCLDKEVLIKRNTKHGAKKDGISERLYRIWKGMKTRCYYKKGSDFKHYGGRGITICDEWKNDYSVFRDWALANRYDDSLSIDRIDNDKGYSPKNCRWATQSQQVLNQRRHKRGTSVLSKRSDAQYHTKI